MSIALGEVNCAQRSAPVAAFDLHVGHWKAGYLVKADHRALRTAKNVAAAVNVEPYGVAQGQQTAHDAHANLKINAGADDEVAIAQPFAKHQVILAIFQIFTDPKNTNVNCMLLHECHWMLLSSAAWQPRART